MIAIVLSWCARKAKGCAVMIWPRPGVKVTLRRSAFVRPFQAHHVPALAPGDRVVFGALSADGVARWAAPWQPPRETDEGDGELGLTSPEPDPEDDREAPNRVVPVMAPVEVPPPEPFWPGPWTAPRRCLWCRRTFLSIGPGERICPRCAPPDNGD